MFRNLEKKIKENFNWKKRSRINFSLGASILFLPFTPSYFQILNSFFYISRYISKSRTSSKNIKTFGCKLIPWNRDQNSKNTICPLGIK